MLPLEFEYKIFELKKLYDPLFYTCCKDIYDKESIGAEKDIGDAVIHILFRPLNFSEVSFHQGLLDRSEGNAREFVLARNILTAYSSLKSDFTDLGYLPIGVEQEVYEMVIAHSSIDDVDLIVNELNEYRALSTDLTFNGSALIIKAFPQMTLRDIENLTISEFTKHLALAEVITGASFQIGDEVSKDNSDRSVLKRIQKEAEMNDRINQKLNDQHQQQALNRGR